MIGLMGRVGASYGYVSKQTQVSKPDSRIYEQKSEVTKMQVWGNDYLPIFIFIGLCILSPWFPVRFKAAVP